MVRRRLDIVRDKERCCAVIIEPKNVEIGLGCAGRKP